MITLADVAKLGALHAVEPTMLSLYLAVPLGPANLSRLTARTDELIDEAETACRAGQPVAAQYRNSVREKHPAASRRRVTGRAGGVRGQLDACGCPDWGTAPLPVPDVIEEMVSRTLEDGGEISVICDGSSPAACLHFPVPRP